MTRDGRIAWVERAQTLSMLLVALHHCVPRGYDGPRALLNLLNAIQYPALACFFLTSALFAGRWRRDGWRAYMKRRFVRLMAPYFCVNLLMLAPRYLAALLMGVRARLTPAWLALSLLDPHGRGVMPHLWFLPALLLMSALLPAIDAAVRRPLPRLATVAALAVLSALPFRLPTLLCLNELKQYLFCYVAGRALAQARGTGAPLRGPAGWAAGGLGLAAFIATLALGDAPATAFLRMLCGGAALLAVAGLSDQADPVAAFFRGKTYAIYILSMCFQNLVEVGCYAARMPWFVTLPAMLAAGLGLPCAVCAWNARHPLPGPLRLIMGL